MRAKLIVFFIGLILGFAPMYLENQRIKQTYLESREDLVIRAESAEERLDEVESELRITELRDQLSSLLLEVRRDNFGTARLQSTHFFNRVRDTLPNVEENDVEDKLRNILNRRDDITAALASADSEAASQLAEIYDSFPRARALEGVPTNPPTRPANAQAKARATTDETTPD